MKFITCILSTVLLSAISQADIDFRINFSAENWLKRVDPPWTEGMERTQVVFDQELNEKVLEVSYPSHNYGNERTGAQFKPEKFDFVKGGKLPGLVGGHRAGHADSVVSGGYPPKNGEGWSARIMWRTNGRLVQYVYHLNQPEKYGQDFEWKVNGLAAVLVRGKWQAFKTEIKINDIGHKNGIIRSWLNGDQALEVADMEFRRASMPVVDAFYFSTFFGGDDSSWSTMKDESIRFADVEIACISEFSN